LGLRPSCDAFGADIHSASTFDDELD